MFRRLSVIVILVGVLAACSGTKDQDTSSSRTGSSEIAADSGVASSAPDSSAGVKAAPAQTLVPDAALPIGRQVVTNATIGLQAKRVGDVAADATAIVSAAGGYLFSENEAAGSRTDAMLVFKVPPAAFSSVMDQLSGLGKRVSRQVTTDDVTAQVVDLESRLRSSTASMVRLRTLYDRADSVGEVVAIEAELVKREGEVEALQGQLRVVQSQVALATVTLDVAKLAPAAPPPTEDVSGFFAGLEQGWDALAAFVGAGATALGVVLPFLVIAGAVGVTTLVVRRRLRLRSTAPTT